MRRGLVLAAAAALLAAALAQGQAMAQVRATDDGSGGGPGYHYDPLRPTVAPGAAVQVLDTGQEPHSVTAVDKSFDVTVQPGGQATFTAPIAPGEYRFYCKFHASPTTQPGQGMAGTLVVVANATSTTPSKAAAATGLPFAVAALAACVAHRRATRGAAPDAERRLAIPPHRGPLGPTPSRAPSAP